MENIAKEGAFTKKIESKSAKIPSDLFFFGAIAMIGVALTFKLRGGRRDDHRSLFFGQWVSPLLILGVYNKIVKTQGHDQEDRSVTD